MATLRRSTTFNDVVSRSPTGAPYAVVMRKAITTCSFIVPMPQRCGCSLV
ncbi:hypothetical protein LINPERHAP1_LOCUS40470 [Linum perenne]